MADKEKIFSPIDWIFGIGICCAVLFASAGEWTQFGHPSDTFEKVCNTYSMKREKLSYFSGEELAKHCSCLKEKLQEEHADTINYTYLIKWMTLDNPEVIHQVNEEFSQKSVDLFNSAYQECVGTKDS